jgi:lysozyme family protein
MVINPSRLGEFQRLAQFAIDHKSQYLDIEQATGVPWWLVAVLHRRESDADFSTYLGNGEPLDRVTQAVPRGRGPFPDFKAGAIDALHLDGLDRVIDWRLEKALWHCERFNGLGYALMHPPLPSPYIWGGTNQQRAGKYVRDGKFDRSVMDTQPGCAPILAEIAKLDPTVQFVRETPEEGNIVTDPSRSPDQAAPVPAPVPVPLPPTLSIDWDRIERLANTVETIAHALAQAKLQVQPPAGLPAPAAPAAAPTATPAPTSTMGLGTGILGLIGSVIAAKTGTIGMPVGDGSTMVGALAPMLSGALAVLGMFGKVSPAVGAVSTALSALASIGGKK